MPSGAAPRLIAAISKLVIFDHLDDGTDAAVLVLAGPATEQRMGGGEASRPEDAGFEFREVTADGRSGEDEQLADIRDGIPQLTQGEHLELTMGEARNVAITQDMQERLRFGDHEAAPFRGRRRTVSRDAGVCQDVS